MARAARVRDWVLADLRGDHNSRPTIRTRVIIAAIGLALIVVALVLASTVSGPWASLCGLVGTVAVVTQLFGALLQTRSQR